MGSDDRDRWKGTTRIKRDRGSLSRRKRSEATWEDLQQPLLCNDIVWPAIIGCAAPELLPNDQAAPFQVD